jgi:hypothetical protein
LIPNVNGASAHLSACVGGKALAGSERVSRKAGAYDARAFGGEVFDLLRRKGNDGRRRRGHRTDAEGDRERHRDSDGPNESHTPIIASKKMRHVVQAGFEHVEEVL